MLRLTTDGHKASSGFTAIAELLVLCCCRCINFLMKSGRQRQSPLRVATDACSTPSEKRSECLFFRQLPATPQSIWLPYSYEGWVQRVHALVGDNKEIVQRATRCCLWRKFDAFRGHSKCTASLVDIHAASASSTLGRRWPLVC